MHSFATRLICVAVATMALVAPGGLPANAEHTPAPASVNLVGTVQSEATAGACGDWDPGCAGSAFAPQGNDVYAFGSATIPKGSYAYKVALGSWAENYGGNFQHDGPEVALTLATERSVRFFYDHKTHYFTDNVRGTAYTVPGSFNSQLGCAGDWAPQCLATLMSDVDGDGTFTFVTSGITTGSYKFKVAGGESWNNNWPADDVAFTVAAAGDTVTVSFTPGTNAVAVAVAGGAGTSEPGDDALALDSLRKDLTAENFYFVMADRFADGNDGNDLGGLTGGRLTTGFDPTDKGFYHGGDLAGLKGKLDYIQGLGTTAIWMTPSFKNKPIQGDGAGEVSAGYHGYWITDFTQIDPHLGTNAELKELVDAAHAKGIKVFFDIITNHTADVIKYSENEYAYRSKAAYPYVDANGNEFDDRDYAGKDTFPPLNVDSFPYTPAFPTAADAAVKKPDWLNDPTLYHNRGDTTFVGENSLYGDFFGLDDLFTERPEVVDGMVDIHKKWITDFGIDGFRVDTVKHVNTEFWQKFAPAIRTHATSVGKPDFFLFGEVFDSNPAVTSTFTTTAKLPAVLDFGFQSTAQGFAASSAATNNVRDFFDKDDLYTDADSNAYSLPTFLGNHDMGRIGRFIRTDANNAGATDAEVLQRDKLAHALMYLTRGMPVVYYGDEQGFTGDGGDKDARQSMFASQVASYNDDDLIGTDKTTATDSFGTDHPLYQAIGEMAALTKAHPALRNGTQQHRLSAAGAGIYAFSRIDRGAQVEYVVALNNSETEQTAAVPTYSAGMSFTGVWPAGLPAASTAADRRLTVTVPPLSAVVYKAASALAPSAAAPAVTVVAPPEGSEVKGRVEVGAQVAGTGYNQVSFAVKVGDAADWTVIGTDDNAPYRVFYDTTGLAQGTVLKFKAVNKDNAGHISSDVGTAVIGAPDVEPGTGSGGVPEYAVVHYNRPAGDYAGWGLHLWGEGLAAGEGTEWATPKLFDGEDGYGRFAWVKLNPNGGPVNFLVHNGDAKDPDGNRTFSAAATPEIWLKSGDPAVFSSRASAQGFAEVSYHRPDGVYAGWGLHLWGDAIADGVATEWATPRMPDRIDDFGAHWTVPVKNADAAVNFILHKGDDKDTAEDRSFVPAQLPHAWLMSGDGSVYKTRGAAQDFVDLHYRRADGDYGDATSNNFADFWGMHIWTGAKTPNGDWSTPVKPTGRDAFGIWFRIPLVDGAPTLSYLLHRGDAKDPGADQSLDLTTLGNEVWFLSGQADSKGAAKYLLPMLTGPGVDADLTKAKAHWVSRDVVLWDRKPAVARSYRISYAAGGGLTAGADGVAGGQVIRLAPDATALTPALKAKWPHLAEFSAYRVRAADLPKVPVALQGQLAISEEDSQGKLTAATGLQIPGVIDDLYANNAALGVNWAGQVPTLRLWAPTAKSVALKRYANGLAGTAATTHAMTRDNATGVWTVQGTAAWAGQYFLYDVEVFIPSTGKVEHNLVTDPYSVSLATNSTRSQIVDLRSAALKPDGWDKLRKPALTQFEDLSTYELHVRDFSIGDTTVPAARRGTYLAFTDTETAGMQHLRRLAKSGLKAVHLLPVFDIATIEERRSAQKRPDCNLGSMAPDSPAQQACVMAVADEDGFNWGYDPLHYTAPEGSYATNPEGAARIREFREMVRGLNKSNLRVVMDVVYNHTAASGQDPKSVLDRVVPGYYHRLSLNGAVETSTCCANTATEHAMMGKLMVDSIVTWARDYKVDGFRFDLMGHHSKANMLDVRAALDALTVAKDGVDGKKIYLYGEGWNFGEVANDARFVQATQGNMAGTGIGTFNDRLRDAVRGGGPFDGNPRIQGFGSGLLTDPNGDPANGTAAAQTNRLLLSGDQLKVGLTGNLKNYSFVDRTGATVTGAQVDYNGAPTGYTTDPQEAITYVEAHDNETLYDALAFKLPQGTSMTDRVRMQALSYSTVLLGQGVPFVHAGGELLRSKSLDRNSYNSGDHFNRLDYSYATNNFGVGLPPAPDNESKWDYMRPLLRNAALRAERPAIVATRDRIEELLRIRASSRLFALGTAALVQQRVAFSNTGPTQIPGVVAMRLSDQVGTDVDAEFESIVVVFNGTDDVQNVVVAGAKGNSMALHPVQAGGSDSVVKGSSFNAGTGAFTVPARTTAVFVQRG